MVKTARHIQKARVKRRKAKRPKCLSPESVSRNDKTVYVTVAGGQLSAECPTRRDAVLLFGRLRRFLESHSVQATIEHAADAIQTAVAIKIL